GGSGGATRSPRCRALQWLDRSGSRVRTPRARLGGGDSVAVVRDPVPGLNPSVVHGQADRGGADRRAARGGRRWQHRTAGRAERWRGPGRRGALSVSVAAAGARAGGGGEEQGAARVHLVVVCG